MKTWRNRPAHVPVGSHERVGRALFLTVTLFALVVLAPMSASMGRRGMTFLASLSLIALVNLAARSRRSLVIAALLGVPALLLQWLVPTEAVRVLRAASYLPGLALDVFVLILMLRHIFLAERVGPVTLFMAVNCYLLIGVIWAGALILCEAFQPGSFRGLSTNPAEAAIDLYYFSFVTLATLGYGDITPVAPLARSLSIAEVLCGVLFTGIIMARLISLYTEEKLEQP